MKLEKCPFCGGTPILELFNDGFFDYARMRCCRVMFDWCGDETGEKAIAAWNSRTDHIRDTTKKVSNADRIRSMSDEELADWIDSVLNQDRDDWDVPGCYSCINYGTHHSDPENKGTYLYECGGCDYEGSHKNGLLYGVLQWLRQPAKEEHNEID